MVKITEIVLPESKIPKAIRQKNEQTALKEEEIQDEKSDVGDAEDNELDNSGDEGVDGDGDDVNDDVNDDDDEEEEEETVALDDDPDLLAPDV